MDRRRMLIVGVWCGFGFMEIMNGAAAWATDPSLRQRIDAEIQAVWKQQKVAPALPADDATFLRRVHLDLTGSIPTYEETKAFLADPSSDKRAKLVDRLLDDPRYASHQAKIWELVIFGRHNVNRKMGDRGGVRKWLQTQFAHNTPYDRWVREMLVADGNSQDNGAPLFYVQFDAAPEQTTVAVTRIFMGMQLQCAECHNHPYEKWTQRDFYGMAAFFARLTLVENGGSASARKFSVGEKEVGDILFTGPAVDAKPGQKGEPIAPKFLNGKPLVEPAPSKVQVNSAKGESKAKTQLPKPSFSRKDQFAAWLTSEDNEYFARAAVNRLWAQLMRRGIVHPIDDLDGKTIPSHPELLDLLTKEFKSRRFDMKWLIREIVNSKTYQLASSGPNGKPAVFEQMALRALTAEEIIHSLRITMGYQPDDSSPNNFERDVLRYLGDDDQGDYQASLTEQLFLNNGSAILGIIRSKSNRLMQQLASSDISDEERVNRLFLSAYNRPPRAEERNRFLEHLRKATTSVAKKTSLEEAVWAVVTSVEYRFNH